MNIHSSILKSSRCFLAVIQSFASASLGGIRKFEFLLIAVIFLIFSESSFGDFQGLTELQSNGTATSLTEDDILSENKEYQINTSVISYFNHNSRIFDRNDTTFESARKLLKLTNDHSIPVFLSTHRPDPESKKDRYFIEENEADYIHFSDSGSHNVEFKGLKTAIFSGGHLTFCLCEAMRDVIKRTESTKNEPVTLLLATDAIFMVKNTILSGWLDPKTSRDVPLPYITDKEYTSVEQVSTYAFQLSEYMSLVSDQAIVGLFESYIFNAWSGTFCTIQHTNQIYGMDKPLPLLGYEFDLYKGEHFLGKIGSGEKRFKVILDSVDNLQKYLPK